MQKMPGKEPAGGKKETEINQTGQYKKMRKGKVDALLGIVFGDEGKGKVVDVFTPKYDIVARFAGGPNAGHTIIFEGKKFVHLICPSPIRMKGSSVRTIRSDFDCLLLSR